MKLQAGSTSMKWLAVFPNSKHWFAGTSSTICLGECATSQTQSSTILFDRQGPLLRSVPFASSVWHSWMQAVFASVGAAPPLLPSPPTQPAKSAKTIATKTATTKYVRFMFVINLLLFIKLSVYTSKVNFLTTFTLGIPSLSFSTGILEPNLKPVNAPRMQPPIANGLRKPKPLYSAASFSVHAAGFFSFSCEKNGHSIFARDKYLNHRAQ
jgi:hypothetical protein